MAEIDEAFHKLSNQNKTFGNIEYFFTQRKVNEDQEYLDKSLNRKNKNISVVYNFLAINIPNVLVDEITTGFDIEIFGDNGFHYKAFLASFQGTVPNFLIPLKGDRKMFVNILPKIESKETKYESENLVFKKNYVAFIEIPKRYQTFEENISNKLVIDEKENVEEEDQVDDCDSE